MTNAVIVGYARSPFHFAGKGGLTRVRPDDMAAQVVRALISRTGVNPEDIEDIILGCAFPEGEQGLNLRVSTTAKDLLIEKGYNVDQGARPMRRAIQDLIEDPLAIGVLKSEFKEGDTISVTAKDGALALKILQPHG